MTDRGNEYSDEDEENEFSSTEDAYDGREDGIGLTAYEAANKRDHLRKYRKGERNADGTQIVGGGGGSGRGSGAAGGGAGAAGGAAAGGRGGRVGANGAGGNGIPNPGDSDSEFENLKEKGSRAKISRVW